ncbi:hypothetical protein KP509_13G047400 [Ceratopteris richardii]|uniref:non-specific serine/threonine protein kinase n=1 Tax=Ceratopteris richardii TaxID=49495 RepID=A0A8T2THH8_CERRI|nr:hypothetical protein KP509_13G047400 [Ceratopteris richardii]
MGNFCGFFMRSRSSLNENHPQRVFCEGIIQPVNGDNNANREEPHHELPQFLGTISGITNGSLRPFSFNELKTATRNFRPDSVVGEGGFGCVFKGWIDENTYKPARPGTGLTIAVKKLNKQGPQGHREWLAEVYFLGKLQHHHLVKLIGYCAEDEHRLLVYEFIARGSLENHLFRHRHRQSLSWALRMKICVGVARALAFLHAADPPVIYRDLKPSNILLDMEYNAKLSDLGLAKDGPTGDDSHVSTRIIGTYGYAAPEYMSTGHLTVKNDVYAFGVVLLEVLTGRSALDKNLPSAEQNLLGWAMPYLMDKHKVYRIIDPQLQGQYSMKGARRLTNLACRCLFAESKLRPTMKEIVEILEPLQDKRLENNQLRTS